MLSASPGWMVTLGACLVCSVQLRGLALMDVAPRSRGSDTARPRPLQCLQSCPEACLLRRQRHRVFDLSAVEREIQHGAVRRQFGNTRWDDSMIPELRIEGHCCRRARLVAQTAMRGRCRSSNGPKTHGSTGYGELQLTLLVVLRVAQK